MLQLNQLSVRKDQIDLPQYKKYVVKLDKSGIYHHLRQISGTEPVSGQGDRILSTICRSVIKALTEENLPSVSTPTKGIGGIEAVKGFTSAYAPLTAAKGYEGSLMIPSNLPYLLYIRLIQSPTFRLRASI